MSQQDITNLSAGQKVIDRPFLKKVFRDDFYIGAALNVDQIRGKESKAMELVAEQFNSITPENILKWEEVHPEPGRYDFDAADQYVAFGEKHGLQIIGHTLVWHMQTPDWVFQDSSGNALSRDALLDRMKEHIFTVMGRYKGSIHGWDVVNEAIMSDGSLRKSKWFEIIGEDYVQKAFEFAREADPDAELYYNDYELVRRPKCEGTVRLVRNLQDQGARVDGVGIQGHWMLDHPPIQDIESMLHTLSDLNVPLMITELDVSVIPFPPFDGEVADINSFDVEHQRQYNPFPHRLPDSVQKKLAERYADLFRLLRNCREISRVTFWAVHDGQSWRNYWPIKGRADYPMLFDQHCRPKPAFDAVIQMGKKK